MVHIPKKINQCMGKVVVSLQNDVFHNLSIDGDNALGIIVDLPIVVGKGYKKRES